jgi:hypothetical protein
VLVFVQYHSEIVRVVSRRINRLRRVVKVVFETRIIRGEIHKSLDVRLRRS